MIGILDLGIGNLGSVLNSLNFIGIKSKLISYNEINKNFTHLIIPGVGSFPTAMQKKDKTLIKDKILEFFESERPMLGICLGMQLFSDYGSEGEGAEGFGLISGQVNQLSRKNNLVLPHVGWNSVKFVKKHPIFEGIKNEIDCYFVHSYHFEVKEKNHSLGETLYGDNFTSIVGKKNLIGFQFHPEKSQKNGLRLLKNFCDWDGKC